MPTPSLPKTIPKIRKSNSIGIPILALTRLLIKMLTNRMMDPMRRIFSEVNTIIVAFGY
jgi:hypothetical protein